MFENILVAVDTKFELVRVKGLDEVEDEKITVIGTT